MKKLLSVILCIAILSTMAVFFAGAVDAEPTVRFTTEPTLSVKRAEGEVVYEMDICFGANEDGSALPFTAFDPEKTVAIRIGTNPMPKITVITANPTAYDAQTGVLTVSVNNHQGEPGMNLHQLHVTEDISAVMDERLRSIIGMDQDMFNNYVEDAQKYMENLFHAAFSYKYDVQLPENLLTGEGVGNAAYTFTASQIEGQVVREETLTIPKTVGLLFKMVSKAEYSDGIGHKLLHKSLERLTKIMKENPVGGLILIILPLIPSLLPTVIQTLRFYTDSLKALSGIKFGGMYAALKALQA